MPLTPSAPDPGKAVERRTTTTTYSGKVPWLWLIAAAVVVPLLLTLFVVFATRGAIRDDLTTQSRQALAAAGIDGALVGVDARDVTLSDVPAGAEQSAIDAVSGVAGVQSVQVAGTVPPPAPVPTPLPIPPVPSGLDDAAVQQQIDGLLAANPVTFVTDSVALTPEGTATVDRVAALLVANPGARVQIIGYVNDTGASADSQRAVSEQRATTVRDRMAQDGVASDRMTTVGGGVGSTDGRRVEIVVL